MNTIELMMHDFLHHHMSYVHNNIEVYILTEKPLLDTSLKETYTLLPFMSMIFLEEFRQDPSEECDRYYQLCL